MASPSSTQDDTTVMIVNGPKSYTVSKKILCSSIPYFEKMLSGHFTESKEEKIEVDFPVAGFHNIMMSLHGVLNFNMAIVLPTLNLAGYLCMEELKQKCLQFFYENFTIKHLPTVLKSLDGRGNFSGILDVDAFAFFCEKYFLKIASTTTFLNLPLEIIEYICKLNLIVDSEYQIFQAIIRWIDANPERMSNLHQLLRCIRWCHIDPSEVARMESELLRKGENIQDVNCLPPNCKNNCGTKRSKDKSLIIIHEITDTKIRISSFDKDLQLFVSDGFYTCDGTLSHELITNGRFSDIIFDSGRKGIRVDWDFRRYNHLDMIGGNGSHYGKILKCIFDEDSKVKVIDKIRGIKLYSESELTNKTNNVSRVALTARVHVKEVNPLEKYSGVLDSIVDDGTGYKLITFHENSYFAYPFEYNWAGLQFDSVSTKSLQINDTIYGFTRDPGNSGKLYMRQYNQSTGMVSIFLNDKTNFDTTKFEICNHNGKLLLCDQLSEKIYCRNDSTKDWDLLYQLETKQRILAIASIVLPTRLVNN